MKEPIHQGQTIERFIHSKGYSITEFAKLKDVNRSFLYSWLNRPILKPKIIQTLSKAIDYDFNAEFANMKSKS